MNPIRHASATYRRLVAAALLAVACQAHAAPAPGLTLVVKPLRAADRVVALEVSEALTDGAPRGDAPLRLKAPLAIFGVRSIAGKITGLAVSDAAGAVPLLMRDDPPATDGAIAYRHWEAARPTVFPVSIRYRIDTQPVTEQGGPPYGMKASGEGVVGSGAGFLLLPENTTSTATRMRWDLSDLPAGSLGAITAGDGDVTVAGPPAEMNDQWMLAGPATVLASARTPGFRAYLLGRPPFDAAEVMDWADRAYAYLAHTLTYLGAPEYRLFFRALDAPSFSTGTARTAGGGSLITVGRTLDRQSLAFVQNTIFHEMAHQWVGQFSEPGAWFSEGLTTYLSAVLPCQAGLAPPASCAEAVNEAAGYYYGSVARNWSLEKIDATVGREDVRRVPYGRGMLYFAQLNAQLLARSHGRRDLAAALQPLFVERQRGRTLDLPAWEAMLRRELGAPAVREFRDAVVDGTATLAPPSDAFGPDLVRRAVAPKPGAGAAGPDGYEWQLKTGN